MELLIYLLGYGVGFTILYFVLKRLYKRCPYCDKSISKKAIKCPYCQSDLRG